MHKYTEKSKPPWFYDCHECFLNSLKGIVFHFSKVLEEFLEKQMEPRIKIFEMIRKSREIERRERVGGGRKGGDR